MILSNVADMLGIGMPEMLILLGILVLFFGAKSIGQSVKELRHAADSAEPPKKKDAA
jgi:Sec-independent protein translocase protein TatA